MRMLLAAAAISAAIVPAHAISRYNSLSLSCAEAQARVEQEGAVILRHQSTRNPSLTLYDRYVVHRGFCQPTEYAKSAWVPTADDRTCFVRVCAPIEYDDDF